MVNIAHPRSFSDSRAQTPILACFVPNHYSRSRLPAVSIPQVARDNAIFLSVSRGAKLISQELRYFA
jgi:hypothetical protein